MILSSNFDNGQGASGAAIQYMNLVTGFLKIWFRIDEN